MGAQDGFVAQEGWTVTHDDLWDDLDGAAGPL